MTRAVHRLAGLAVAGLLAAGVGCKLDPNPAWGADEATGSSSDSTGATTSDSTSSETNSSESADSTGDVECPPGSSREVALKDNPDGLYCMVDNDFDGWGDHNQATPIIAGRDCDDMNELQALCLEQVCVDQPNDGGLYDLSVVNDLWDHYQWSCAPGILNCGLDGAESTSLDVSVGPSAPSSYRVEASLSEQPFTTVAHATVHSQANWDLVEGCSVVELQAGGGNNIWTLSEAELIFDGSGETPGSWLYRCPIEAGGAKIQLDTTLRTKEGSNNGNYGWFGLAWGYGQGEDFVMLQWFSANAPCDDFASLKRFDWSDTGWSGDDFSCSGDGPGSTSLGFSYNPGPVPGWNHQVPTTYRFELELGEHETSVRIIDVSDDKEYELLLDDELGAQQIKGELAFVVESRILATVSNLSSSCL